LVQVRILLYPRADILATVISWTDRPALGGHCEGAAARDVRAPPRVCAEADLHYVSYINLAPPFRLYAAAVGRGSNPLGGMETTVAHFVRVHPSATPCHLAAGRWRLARRRRHRLSCIRIRIRLRRRRCRRRLRCCRHPPTERLNSVWSFFGVRRRVGQSLARPA